MNYGPGALPLESIVYAFISLVLIIGVPVGTLIAFRKKSKASLAGVGIGALMFVVFVTVEKLIQSLVFSPSNASGQFFMSHIGLMCVVAALFAGVFEEVGRYTGFTILKKKHPEKEEAVMYGIGHGGIEAILIGAVTAFGNLMAMIMLYNAGLDALLAGLSEADAALASATYSVFYYTDSFMFMLSGIERVSAFVAHMGMSIVVYKSIADKKIVYLFLAIAMHFALDMIAGFYSMGFITNVYIIEIIVAILAIIYAYIGYRIYKNMTSEVI